MFGSAPPAGIQRSVARCDGGNTVWPNFFRTFHGTSKAEELPSSIIVSHLWRRTIAFVTHLSIGHGIVHRIKPTYFLENPVLWEGHGVPPRRRLENTTWHRQPLIIGSTRRIVRLRTRFSSPIASAYIYRTAGAHIR